MKKERLPETAVARPVVAYLEDLQWDVYQEVESVAGRADIIGLQGSLVYVVEVKTSLTMDVLEQAVRWLDAAHYVSVAVPWVRTRRDMAQRVCKLLGIGLLEVQPDYRTYSTGKSDKPPAARVEVRVPPAMGRRRVRYATAVRLHCVPECKTWAEAGSNGGGYFTPFNGTCEAVREYLKAHGPSTVREVVAGIKHHYRSDNTARQCIPRWVMYNKVKGVIVDCSTHPSRLRLKTPEDDMSPAQLALAQV